MLEERALMGTLSRTHDTLNNVLDLNSNGFILDAETISNIRDVLVGISALLENDLFPGYISEERFSYEKATKPFLEWWETASNPSGCV